jgi:hypothetical protein
METDLADYYIRYKDVGLLIRRIEEIYEKYRERKRQTNPESKDSRYTLIKKDK